MKDLAGIIEKSQRQLKRGLKDSDANEAAVSIKIIQPILEALGWDRENMSFQYPVGRKKANIVLFGDYQRQDDGLPSIIVEAKALGKIKKNSQEQLFSYVEKVEPAFEILTDGREWHIFVYSLPTTTQKHIQVDSIDITNGSPTEIAKKLKTYLEINRVEEGDAHKEAIKKASNYRRRENAKKQIPKLWKRLLKEHPEKLIRFFNRFAQDFPKGKNIYEDDVLNFFRTLNPPSTELQGTETQSQTLAPYQSTDSPPKTSGREKTGGKREPTKYVLFGQYYEKTNAVDCYKHIFQAICDMSPDMPERLKQAFQERVIISRDIEEMKMPDRVRALRGGWYMDCNLSNHRKCKFIEEACRITNIPFGDESGIKIIFMPKTKYKTSGREKTGNKREPTKYVLFGQYYEKTNAVDCYERIFQAICDMSPDMPDRLEQAFQKKYSIISRDKKNLKPAANISNRARELKGGWHIDCNLNNSNKCKLIEEACEEANIPFGDGKGVKIIFMPKTKAQSQTSAPYQSTDSPPKTSGREKTGGKREPKEPKPKPLTEYFLFGQYRKEKKAVDCYIDIFQAICDKSPDTPVKLEQQSLQEGSYPFISRDEKNLKPSARSEKLRGGWYINKTSDNNGRCREIEKACEVANIPFDNESGVKIISMPNTHYQG